jgi:hypothetical protein
MKLEITSKSLEKKNYEEDASWQMQHTSFNWKLLARHLDASRYSHHHVRQHQLNASPTH